MLKILISPAKKMKEDLDTLPSPSIPEFIEDTKVLLDHLQGLNYEQLKSIWNCNDKIATLNYERIRNLNLYRNLTPAILSYEGIQYQYMAPYIFQTEEYQYLKKHLRIISGFYGMLRPFDGVVPYRLEMQAKLNINPEQSLYTFWNHKLAGYIFHESTCIVNLASKEYYKGILDYLSQSVRIITCIFGEISGDKVVEKGVHVKMARGEMVRFMAERKIENPEEMKEFHELNYTFHEALSDENTYVFIRNQKDQILLSPITKKIFTK